MPNLKTENHLSMWNRLEKYPGIGLDPLCTQGNSASPQSCEIPTPFLPIKYYRIQKLAANLMKQEYNVCLSTSSYCSPFSYASNYKRAVVQDDILHGIQTIRSRANLHFKCIAYIYL